MMADRKRQEDQAYGRMQGGVIVDTGTGGTMHTTHRQAGSILALVAALVAGCGSPSEVCACSDPLPWRVIEGSVVDASSAPLPGATLTWYDRTLGPESAPPGAVVASETGAFRLEVYSYSKEEEISVAILVAHESLGDTVTLELTVTTGFNLPVLAQDLVIPD